LKEHPAGKISENLKSQVGYALTVLEKLLPSGEFYGLDKEWRDLYQESIEKRKKQLSQNRTLVREQIKQVRQWIKKGNYQKAQQALIAVKEIADQRQKKRVLAEEQKIARILLYKLEALLSKKPTELSKVDLDEAQKTLDCLKNIPPQSLDMRTWMERRWLAHQQQREVENARSELATLWQSPYTKWRSYEQALDLAERTGQVYPDNPLAQELFEEAKRLSWQAERHRQELLGAAAECDFETLIDKLMQLSIEFGIVPKCEWNPEHTAITVHEEHLPGKEVIDCLRELASEYADDKADEHLRQARQAVGAGDYLTAEKQLEDAFCSQYVSTSKHEQVQEYWDNEVAIPVLNRRQATRLAKAAIECQSQDILKAWSFFEEAWKLAPGLEEVDRACQKLIRPVRRYLRQLNRDAREAMHRGDSETAKPLAEQALSIAQKWPHLFKEAFRAACGILSRCHDQSR
jgi:ribosomal protein S20